jgi:hypothetical protein
MSDTDDLGYTVSTTSAEALEAYDQGVPVGLMAPAVARIHDMGGGSREQKDIFQDVLMALHRRLGHVDAVSELAQRRLALNPNHFQSLAAFVEAQAALQAA